jgi:hypothetical protein
VLAPRLQQPFSQLQSLFACAPSFPAHFSRERYCQFARTSDTWDLTLNGFLALWYAHLLLVLEFYFFMLSL